VYCTLNLPLVAPVPRLHFAVFIARRYTKNVPGIVVLSGFVRQSRRTCDRQCQPGHEQLMDRDLRPVKFRFTSATQRP